MASRWTMLAVVFVARLSLGFQFQSIASVAPPLMSGLHLSYAELGWLIGLFSLPGVVIALPGGLLGRRFGERDVAVAALAFMVVGALIVAASSTFLLACVGRTVSGIGFVIANTVFAKMVADWFAGKEIATAMAVMLTAWPAGISVALIALGAMATAFSWRMGLQATAIVAAVALVLMLAVYRQPPHPGATAPVAGAKITRAEAQLAMVGGVTWGMLNGAVLVFVSFTPGLLIEEGASMTEAGAIVSLMLGVSAVTIPLGGYLVDRVRRDDLIIIANVVQTGAAMAALALLGAPLFWSIVVAMTIAGAPGAIMALLPRAVRPEVLGTAFGAFYSVYYAVVALAQPAAGIVRDVFGRAEAPVVFAGVLMGLTALVHLAFMAMRAAQRTETT